MVAIAVGASTITSAAGEKFDLDLAEIPRDLLVRVASNTPCVSLTKNGIELQPAHQIYARIVTSALHKNEPSSLGGAPIPVATPGWWTPRTLDRVHRAFAEQNVSVALVNEAEATVIEHRHGGNTLPDTVAVVSLRSEQVSAVIVRNCTGAPTALTSPVRVHSEGGAHLDAVVLRHLVLGLTHLGDNIHHNEPHTVAAAQDALRQCQMVRESLSSTVTESVLPDLPGATHRIRIVRSELEELSQPWANAVVTMLRTVIDQSAVPIGAVIVTGGLAAMPLVSQRISANLGLEVHVPSDPELVAAQGAARVSALREQPTPRQRFPLWRKKKKEKDSPASRKGAAHHSEHFAEFDELISTIFDSPSKTEKHFQSEHIEEERLIGADDR